MYPEQFAQIIDEAWWGFNADDSVQAEWHWESIKQVIDEFEDGFMANEIPEELGVV